MKIAAIVVTYYPDKDLLFRNIEAFADYVDLILIWRNSPEDFDYNGLLNKWMSKIIFMGTGQNLYMAKPLNIAINYCLENDYNYLLTMDQDSCWEDFSRFVHLVDLYKECLVAIYAPNVNNYLDGYPFEYKDIEWVIQSGMLLDINVVKDSGGFREDYGIYGVDEEFCYWLRLHGKKIRSFTNCHLKQKYGNAQKSCFGFWVYNYSPIVRYFLIRNMIWMKREFKDSTITRRIIHVILQNIRDILLVEDNKKLKLQKFFQGISHGLFKSIIKRVPANF